MTKYEAAIIKHNAAMKIYHKVLDEYRARKIGDAEFLASRKIYDAATAEFDAAYAVEAGWTRE